MPDKSVTLKHLFTLREKEQRITDVSWAPSGKYIAACTPGEGILVWDFDDRSLHKKIGLRRILGISAPASGDKRSPAVHKTNWIPSTALNVSWSHEGEVFAYVARMDRVAIYDTQVNLPPEELAFGMRAILRVLWIPHTSQILAASVDGIWRWDLLGAPVPHRVLETGFIPYALEVNTDGNKLAISSHTGKVWVVSNPTTDARVDCELEGVEPATYGLSWCPSGERLAGCMGDGTIRVWGFPGSSVVGTLEGHGAPCLSVAFSADGKLLASKSVDNTLRLWSAEDCTELFCVEEPTGKSFGRIAFHPSKNLLASRGPNDVGVRIWQLSMDRVCKDGYPDNGPGATITEGLPQTRSIDSNSRHDGSLLPKEIYSFAPRLLAMKPDDGRDPARCFISYARGNARVETWIEDFALFLRHDCKLEVLFDRWHSQPGSSVTKFFDGLSDSDFIIPIGTLGYRQKYDSEDSDPVVDAEIRMVSRILSKRTSDRKRVLPILLEGDMSESFPGLFEDSVIVDCRTASDTREQLPELLATLLGIDFGSREFIAFRRGLRNIAEPE